MRNLRNSVQLIGRLGKDPVVKTFNNNTTKVSFSLATTESYINADKERVYVTQWHNIVVWGATAKYAEKALAKGAEIALEGKLQTRSYTDKEDNTRYITEIIANEIILLDKKEREIAA